jgi:betaine-homocysteine S-methyltransferase
MERLREGPVIGDGGQVFFMEKRGWLRAGPWTPEATCEAPAAVENMHTEFAHAGCDVHQVFSFYASEDKLANRGNEAAAKWGVTKINAEGCRLAKKVADEYGGLVAGGICQTPSFLSGASKEKVQEEFHKQIRAFQAGGVDFMIAEYYEHITEMEWAIEACKQYNMPVFASMCINKHGDMHGTTAEECAVRMADAGADIVGINCHFDPFVSLECMQVMKNALEKSGHLKNPDFHLGVQPLAYWTPECATPEGKQGFIDLPEFPFALEARVLTRWEMQRFAREAHEMGIRFIGGCCGFEAYHVRAMVEELEPERNGKVGNSSKKHERWGGGLSMHTKPWVRARATKGYWTNISPATGRPMSPSLSKPDAWGVTQGNEELKQQEVRQENVSRTAETLQNRATI